MQTLDRQFDTYRDCVEFIFSSDGDNLVITQEPKYIDDINIMILRSFDHGVDYSVARFVGLERAPQVPAELRNEFSHNRFPHAALDFIGRAHEVFTNHQKELRYDHEKQIHMNWKNYARSTVCQCYAATLNEVGEAMRPAYQAFALMFPEKLPVAPQILAFETKHDLTRKRGVILRTH